MQICGPVFDQKCIHTVLISLWTFSAAFFVFWLFPQEYNWQIMCNSVQCTIIIIDIIDKNKVNLIEKRGVNYLKEVASNDAKTKKGQLIIL